MNHNYVFSDVSEALPVLLRDLLKEGDEVPSRAGLTKEFTHVGITLVNPRLREVLVPHRKPNIAAQIAETAWVLAGRDDISWLKHYLPRAADFSDDGLVWRAAYGPRLHSQLGYVIDLLRRDPSSRQAVITLWEPGVDSKPGRDIACNNWLHFLARDGELHLHVGIRSNDVIWGWSGINTFEWSVLLEVVAGLTDLEMGKLHFSVSSEHLYEHHWDRARKIVDSGEQLNMFMLEPSPAFDCGGIRNLEDLDILFNEWFEIENRLRRGLLCPEIASFPEPMLRSWLYVLEWWWGFGDFEHLSSLHGTRLHEATMYSIQPPSGSPFIREVVALHNEKSAAYGDSWCRRGETLGILANIARKVDRLGTGLETSDETTADTAIDLMVYLAKYYSWLRGDASTEGANAVLRTQDQRSTPLGSKFPFQDWFDQLEQMVAIGENSESKMLLVERMLSGAYHLARSL